MEPGRAGEAADAIDARWFGIGWRLADVVALAAIVQITGGIDAIAITACSGSTRRPIRLLRTEPDIPRDVTGRADLGASSIAAHVVDAGAVLTLGVILT